MAEISIVPAFLPLYTKKKRFKSFHGGRGGAKSIGFADALLERSRTEQCIILCTREVQKSIKESVMSLLRDRINKHGWSSEFDVLQAEIRHKTTGSRFIFAGLRDHTVDSIKSFQNVKYCWIEEAQSVTKRSLDVLIPTIRAEDSEIWFSYNRTEELDPCYSLFQKEFETQLKTKRWKFRDKVLEWQEFETDSAFGCYINFDGNPFFPDVLEKERIRCFNRSINDYNHVWLGQARIFSDDALWKIDWINDNRQLKDLPDFNRIVVAVDPAVSNNPDSDETGIVTIGMAKINGEEHFYVLSDESCQGSPLTWSTVAVSCYHEFAADLIVAEVNQGGDLVESSIRQIDKHLRYKAVRATRGKVVRAEPVVALYEQGRVHHTDMFTTLEHQLCSWSPTESKNSPDRLDALVWGISHLAKLSQYESGAFSVSWG